MQVKSDKLEAYMNNSEVILWRQSLTIDALSLLDLHS